MSVFFWQHVLIRKKKRPHKSTLQVAYYDPIFTFIVTLCPLVVVIIIAAAKKEIKCSSIESAYGEGWGVLVAQTNIR